MADRTFGHTLFGGDRPPVEAPVREAHALPARPSKADKKRSKRRAPSRRVDEEDDASATRIGSSSSHRLSRESPLVSLDESPSEESFEEVNVIALVKGEERYVFLYDDARTAETLKLLGRYASDPALSFNWVDAAIVSDKIRRHMPNVPSGSVKVEVIPPIE